MTERALSREAIVATARRLLGAHGIGALSLRRLAAELGVTAPALYAHVDGKADLLAALAEAGFDELVRRYDEIVGPSTPIGRLRSLGDAYVDQALADPELFRVMFRFRPRPFEGAGPGPELPAATRAFEHPYEAVLEAIRAGELQQDVEPMLVALTLWTVAHGTAEVLLLGLGLTADQERELRESVLGAALRGLTP